ncbi:MAG: DUF3570 domain-containing protein [Casimicrobiaceae bacterium]
MAATEGAASAPQALAAAPETGSRGDGAGRSTALLAAAMALPGVTPGIAGAQDVADDGVIALKYLDYRDWQPGAARMRVRAPGLYVRKPLPDSTVLEGTLVHDTMSGASPLYFNTLSGASGIGVTDYRTAGDVKVTRDLGRYAFGVGAAISAERDYLSRALSTDLRISSEDRNRTWTLGFAGAADRIDSVNGVALDERRHTLEILVGVTQVLSATTLVQSNLAYATGHGYYDDPYKLLDARPDHRRTLAWLTRVNQRVPALDATVQMGYRFVSDSFGSDVHTLELAWVQTLPHGIALTPSLRYTSQSAADFYHDPPFPRGFVRGGLYTADTRLAAFGAVTPGLKVAVELGAGWSVDFKLEAYRQRAQWRLGGGGSPGIEPLSARWVQIGAARRF